VRKHVVCNEVGGLYLFNKKDRKWLGEDSSVK
jgi:hypothetical protein